MAYCKLERRFERRKRKVLYLKCRLEKWECFKGNHLIWFGMHEDQIQIYSPARSGPKCFE